jgi:two-component system sensor histidine kinase RpfC
VVEGLGLGLLLSSALLAISRGRLLRRLRRGRAEGAPEAPEPPITGPVVDHPSDLPAEAPLEVGSEVAPAAPPRALSRKVLVLADGAVAAELIAAVRGWGFRWERVASTSRAFARLVSAAERGAAHHAVIVDGRCLQVGPGEFLAALREEALLQGVRALLVAPATDAAVREGLRRDGYAAVLGLPLDRSAVFGALAGEPASAPRGGNTVSLAAYRQRLQAGPQRVLVADDNPVSRNALKAILERADYEVHVASDGEEALDVLARGRPGFDVLVLDVQMPGRSGLDVLRAYRFIFPQSRAPVVMLTGDPSAALRDACLRSGAAAFLPKPVEPRELLETLSRVRARGPVQPDRSAPGPGPGVGDAEGPPRHRLRLDEATLEGLRRLGRDPGFLGTLVNGFIREGAETLARVEKALAAGDRNGFLDAVQALRGAAGDIGAREVAGLCERIQEVPQERLVSPRMALLLEALTRTFEATAVALTEYVQRARGAAQ